jgi:hypothetical protein
VRRRRLVVETVNTRRVWPFLTAQRDLAMGAISFAIGEVDVLERQVNAALVVEILRVCVPSDSATGSSDGASQILRPTAIPASLMLCNTASRSYFRGAVSCRCRSIRSMCLSAVSQSDMPDRIGTTCPRSKPPGQA